MILDSCYQQYKCMNMSFHGGRKAVGARFVYIAASIAVSSICTLVARNVSECQSLLNFTVSPLQTEEEKWIK